MSLVACGCTGLGDGKLLNLAAREQAYLTCLASNHICGIVYNNINITCALLLPL